MNQTEIYFDLMISDVTRDFQNKMGRPLTESQIAGLRQAGTLMFLENMIMGFYCAKDEAAIEKWAQEIDGFHRQ